LRLINGSTPFEIRRIGDDWLLTSDPQGIFAMWRAFKFVPLHGQFVDAAMPIAIQNAKRAEKRNRQATAMKFNQANFPSLTNV
jgi:hypothetical protein